MASYPKSNNYLDMGDYSPSAIPMFSRGQGIPQYAPPVQAPASNGMDWGFSQPKFEFNDSALASVVPTAPAPGILESMGNWFKDSGFVGSKNKDGTSFDGWGGTAVGLANGLMNGYMGMKQFGLSNDILNNNKAQFAQNFAAQRGTTNAALADRQARRVREANANGNPSSATSVADYMAKYGVA